MALRSLHPGEANDALEAWQAPFTLLSFDPRTVTLSASRSTTAAADTRTGRWPAGLAAGIWTPQPSLGAPRTAESPLLGARGLGRARVPS